MKRHALRRCDRGVSLIELMVAVGIGLVVTLVVSNMLIRSEASKRSTTSVNDVNQTGTFASYVLDRAVRSAGSGYAQRWQQGFGCVLRASRNSAAVLPRNAAFPAPFTSIPQTQRLAPIVVHKGASVAGSDVLAVMTGSAGFGESPSRAIIASVTGSGLRMINTLGMRGNDLVMLIEDGQDCMLQQVQSTFTGSDDQALPFAGTYFSATAGGGQLTTYGVAGTNLYVVQLGNAASGATPQFQLLGVGANNTLFSHDMLQLDGSDAPVPIADGVVELRAVYGVDSNDDNLVDAWVDPGVSPYTAAELTNGSAAARVSLRRILAVRVGMVLRTSLQERSADYTAPTTVTLFNDLGVPQTRTLTTAERAFRHRTVEFTVPLRNVLLLPNT